MAADNEDEGRHRRWAHLRFGIVGPLLAAPPPRGELAQEIRRLAARTWRHPLTGLPVQFGFSTIERWLHQVRDENDPVGLLCRKVRRDAGEQPSMTEPLRRALLAQYEQHRSWSYKLHRDNLVVLVERDPSLGVLPSYSTVLRYMKAHGLRRLPRMGPRGCPGPARAEQRLVDREVRSYEAAYVNGLWHTDFHSGSLAILTAQGERHTPQLLGLLDDRSRLCCHAQWYMDENVEEFDHGLSQAFQKRELPRELMSDNGDAMIAAETVQGLARLSVIHDTTLAYSPYQNGKQEVFWAQVEGRLLAMLEGMAGKLTLALLNQATQAWVEMEYNRNVHSVAMRQLAERLGTIRDVVVGVLSRPQAGLADFYRELGHLYGVPLAPHNRWAGAKALRETWLAHIDAAVFRPVLLVDEAQEARPEMLCELRLLASADLDSRAVLTVVLAGDRRLQELLRLPTLLPLDGRLRVRLVLDAATREELTQCLRHAMEKTGNPKLMTPELIATIVEHAAGNCRAMMILANELLLAGAQREVRQLDEKLFFDVFSSLPADKPRVRSQSPGRHR